MSTPPTHALVTTLTAADPATCDRTGLAQLVALSQQVRAWLDAIDASVAARAAQLAAEGRCEPAAAVLTGRRSARDGDAAARRGEVCALLPGLHDALAAGEVSAGHADAVVRAAQSLDEAGRAELAALEETVVATAVESSVEDFSRSMAELARVLSRDEGVSRHEWRRRQRCVRRWFDRQSGMCHTHLSVDPETDERIARALGAAVASERQAAADDDDRKWDQLQADAFVGLVTGARSLDRRVPEVVMLIDQHTMRDGLHERTVSETGAGQPIPPETVRRTACDASVVPIRVDRRGVVVDVGRTRRTATHTQRSALRAMHRTCAHPGCAVAFDACDVHHVVPWHHGGRTDLDNLLPLCSRDHHLVHEGGWTLTLHPDRTVDLHRPDGQLHHAGSSVDVAPHGIGVSAALARAVQQQLARHHRGPPAA
jgi:hypothetical protein